MPISTVALIFGGLFIALLMFKHYIRYSHSEQDVSYTRIPEFLKYFGIKPGVRNGPAEFHEGLFTEDQLKGYGYFAVIALILTALLTMSSLF